MFALLVKFSRNSLLHECGIKALAGNVALVINGGTSEM